MFNATTEDGDKIKEGGLYVTNSFAKLANIKVGDKLSVTPYQDKHQYTLVLRDSDQRN
ncbi:hypothetical protein [Streptococcus equi]|uniref:hypothetical protein n=1 Tax=Streptococcus equi TaxID=1336 RepID=UPI001E2D854E|nr:hypothetical protein [Streptococcus equi]